MDKNHYYSRQIFLKEIGIEGQKKLGQKKVLVVGAGGLGHPVSTYLAAAGIGRLTIIDFDKVEFSNLNRQIFFSPEDEKKSKVNVLVQQLQRQNPFIFVEGIQKKICFQNVRNILPYFDVVVDCSDNFSTKFLLHDFCFLLKKDLVQASVYKYEGQIQVFSFSSFGGKSAEKEKKTDLKQLGCMRCLWPTLPKKDCFQSCAEVGVVGALVGCIGSIQAMEVLKLILRIGKKWLNSTIIFDLLDFRLTRLDWKKNPECFLCGEKEPILCEEMYFSKEDYELTNLDQKDFIFVDIREKKEIEQFPIAKNILESRVFLSFPLSQLSHWKGSLKKNQKYLFICAQGHRSAHLVRELKKEPIIPDASKKNFYSLYGGLGFYFVD